MVSNYSCRYGVYGSIGGGVLFVRVWDVGREVGGWISWFDVEWYRRRVVDNCEVIDGNG